MKKTFIYFTSSIIVLTWSFSSCKKELFCQDCGEANKPPVANAGADQTITLPKDSAVLDGNNSIDMDGTISSYKWTNISGPAPIKFSTPDASKTSVKTLVMGVYYFELTVKDNDGVSAKDTVRIIVDNPAVNQPPDACAGTDQTIMLPTNAVTINGNCSADPENNITNYAWMKIAGPTSFTITTTNAVQTQVTNLDEGVYDFELTVTDAGSLSSKDTVRITVVEFGGRPITNATLTEIGVLSEPRLPAIGAAGSKIVFAGGANDLACLWEKEWTSDAVDIYDIVTGTWSTARLSQNRSQIAVVNTTNRIFFAGGVSWADFGSVQHNVSYNNVDIYDVTTNTWSVAYLSKAREAISAVTVGNKVLFAGGSYFTGNLNLANRIWDVSDVVDIYDISTNSWSTAKLSVPRSGISAIVIGEKVFFAGGYSHYGGSQDLNIVDVYNSSSNTWSTSTLPGDIAFKWSQQIADYIIWPGQNPVTIKNISSGTTVSGNISSQRSSVVGLKNNTLAFFSNAGVVPLSLALTRFDLFNTGTSTWSVGKVQPRDGTAYSSKIAVNNKIYLAGGVSEDQYGCFNLHGKIYVLDW